MTAPHLVFGRVDNPEQINLEPFTFDLVGYRVQKNGKRKEEVYTFTCSGISPFSDLVTLIRTATEEAARTLNRTIDYIRHALVDDAERERFDETIAMPDVWFEPQLLVNISRGLMEEYAGRPTLPPTDSPSGDARGGRRSTARRGSRASATSANGHPG